MGMIAEKVDEKVPAPFGFQLFRGVAKTAISHKITESVIASKLAEKMPAKMKDMGIEAECEEVFRRGAFVVVKVTIVHADLVQILSQAKGEEMGQKSDKVMSCLKSLARCLGKEEKCDSSMDAALTKTIATKMCEKLEQTLPEKMSENGLQVNAKVLPESEEAKYFFEILGHLPPEK